MTTVFKLPSLEAIHPPLRDARRRAEELGKEYHDKVARTQKDIARGAYHVSQKYTTEMRHLKDAVRDSQYEVVSARASAEAFLKERLQGDGAFRKLLAEVAEGLAARLRPFAAYEAVRLDAARGSVALPSLPGPIVAEMREGRAWARWLMSLGILSLDDCPPILRPPEVG